MRPVCGSRCVRELGAGAIFPAVAFVTGCGNHRLLFLAAALASPFKQTVCIFRRFFHDCAIVPVVTQCRRADFFFHLAANFAGANRCIRRGAGQFGFHRGKLVLRDFHLAACLVVAGSGCNGHRATIIGRNNAIADRCNCRIRGSPDNLIRASCRLHCCFERQFLTGMHGCRGLVQRDGRCRRSDIDRERYLFAAGISHDFARTGADRLDVQNAGQCIDLCYLHIGAACSNSTLRSRVFRIKHNIAIVYAIANAHILRAYLCIRFHIPDGKALQRSGRLCQFKGKVLE